MAAKYLHAVLLQLYNMLYQVPVYSVGLVLVPFMFHVAVFVEVIVVCCELRVASCEFRVASRQQ